MTRKRVGNPEMWLREADLLDGEANPLKVPYDVALKEGAQVAAFARAHWTATDARPGLVSVQGRLPKTIADEIVAVIGAVSETQTKLLLSVDPAVAANVDRARYVVNELDAELSFVLDDGVDDADDERLARIKAFRARQGRSTAALAQALSGYGALAEALKGRIEADDAGFDLGLIDEAKRLSQLVLSGAVADTTPEGRAIAKLTVRRNQLLRLLTEKVTRVRSAAKHVYRHHPDEYRQVTSAYERRRRATARAKAGQAAGDGATGGDAASAGGAAEGGGAVGGAGAAATSGARATGAGAVTSPAMSAAAR